MIGFLGLLILIGVTWLATRLIFPRGRDTSDRPSDHPPSAGPGSQWNASGQPFAGPGSPVTGVPRQPWGTPAAGPYSPPSPAAAQPLFDQEAFLRDAKTLFVRMQAAYDRGDLNDIQQFTTPEIFADISRQSQARGDAFSRTDVVALQAELLELRDANGFWSVSIRFTGMVHEDSALLAHPFCEIWRFQRPEHGEPHWRIASVEQLPPA